MKEELSISRIDLSVGSSSGRKGRTSMSGKETSEVSGRFRIRDTSNESKLPFFL